MTDSENSTGIEMTISKKQAKQKDKLQNKNDESDPIIKAIGHIGSWQIAVCLTIFMMKFPVGWHQLATVFLAPPIDFECFQPNGTDKCSSECTEIKYDRSIFQETIITEWNLICDQKYLANLSQTLFMFGILVGNVLFGIWSDKSGRRPPLVFSVLMQLVCGVGAAFSPWFWLFCVLRFLTAVATGGSMVTSFVLIMEIVGPAKREIMTILYHIPFNIGHFTLPVFSYFLRNWRWYQFGISVPSVVLISYYWLIPESPRWLFTMNKLEKSAAVLEKAAKFNKMPHEKIHNDLEETKKQKDANMTDEHRAAKKGTVLDLLRHPNLRLKTICVCFNWFVCGLTFFGVSQYIGGVGGDIFVNVAVSGFLGIPGTIVSVPLAKYWGRKKTLFLANVLAGVSMCLITIVPANATTVKVMLSAIGVFGMTLAFPIVYMYGGELFPTVVRNAGIGVASMVARVGSMLAPHVATTADIAPWLPPMIFGAVPLIGAMLVLFLPETRGQPLPDTIEEGEKFGKKLSKV